MQKDRHPHKAPGSADLAQLFAAAVSAFQAGQYPEAHQLCAAVVERDKKNIAALHLLGVLEALRHRADDALRCFDRALRLGPRNADILADKGKVLSEAGRHQDALACYQESVSINPVHGIALLNQGCSLLALSRPAEALAIFDRLLNFAANFPPALKNRGVALKDLNRLGEAADSYRQALVLDPQDIEAWCNVGDVFLRLKRFDEALGAYDKALVLKPDLAEAWLGRGNVFNELKRYDEAFAAYDKAFAFKPELTGAEGIRLHAKMQICDWSNYDAECAHLTASIQSGHVAAPPFVMLSIPASSEDLLCCARLWVAENYPPSANPFWRGERYNHDRIRLGYLSADFRQHPVSILAAGLFESHDKSRFDVTAISTGPDDGSDMRQRLKGAFDRFVDAEKASDDQVAALIRELEIDVMVDLMGFTALSRPGVMARRGAPVQASYLGYAGTMGAGYVDYIIADRIVIPEEQRQYYSEKTVYLPDSFIGHDSKRTIAGRTPTRSECGLPRTGFVFCAFGNTYKIVPSVFDIWMRLLRRVQGSVLWLSGTNEGAIRNLQREAQNRGVDPARLVFAPRVPRNEDHLARYRLADLFLDMLPYNAHATASDALWAGLPVLTLRGEIFAGRVAASLLSAAGLPELITTVPDAYELMAIELATQPEKLGEIRRKLAANRLTTPLFDTRLFTRHIEAAYLAMIERHRAGLAPDHIVISN